MNIPLACLVDLDGVLLDTEPLSRESWRNSARAFGIELSNNQLDKLKGKRRVDCANEILNYLEKKVSIDVFMKTHMNIVKRTKVHPKAIKGAESLINCFYKHKIPI